MESSWEQSLKKMLKVYKYWCKRTYLMALIANGS